MIYISILIIPRTDIYIYIYNIISLSFLYLPICYR